VSEWLCVLAFRRDESSEETGGRSSCGMSSDCDGLDCESWFVDSPGRPPVLICGWFGERDISEVPRAC